MEADYIVVGAGSAGCIVASRLSESGASVVLLEAGKSDSHPYIHIPAAVSRLMHDRRFNWNYTCEPEEGTAGRRLPWPRGKVMGGSGSINGMNFVRGNRMDFDGWAQMGCRGWSYDDVLPYFKSMENRQEGDAQFRGRGGPLPVENYRTVMPITRAFAEAAQQAGFAFTSDINGEQQEGVGFSQMNRTRVRRSTARTFLADAQRRSNLRIEKEAHVTRLVFDGRRCTGLEFSRHGQAHKLAARREVILCAGAINSPHLLQLSGIGPAVHLKSIGIEVRHDLPGVGAHLMDHYQSKISHRATGIRTLNELSRGWRLALACIRWAIDGRGPLTFGVTQASLFCRSGNHLASPDLQLLFVPASFDSARIGQLEPEPGMTITVCPGRPDSRGTVMAQSSDPFAAPLIRANYLSVESDRAMLVAGLRIARRVFAAPALARLSAGELAPGPAVKSDADLLAYARQTGGSVYHPAGTCRMGEDPEAVVDSQLRVRGIEALRVIDASVMPTLTTGNINAPTMMIGEKGAALIRQAA